MRTRRQLLGGVSLLGLSSLLACRDDEGDVGCDDDPFAGGELLGVAAFDEAPAAFHTRHGEGLDGRLVTDLSVLGPEALITPTEHFYIRTLYPDLLDPDAPWSLTIDGLVKAPATLSMDDLLPLAKPQGVHLLECSGNSDGSAFGLMSAAEWAGVDVEDVLARVERSSKATRVLMSGFDEHSTPSANEHSTPGASWVFTFDELRDAGAFLATEMNGEPLSRDHGFPLRLLVPGWYGCACIKWVDTVRLVDDDEPATSQMKEFASRTHQKGTPELARDYQPATQDQAAMPVRVERWRVNGERVYRLVGILWGGTEPTTSLSLLVDDGEPEPVRVCEAPTTNATWSLWSHPWRPPGRGTYRLRMQIDDPAIRTRRLDRGWYDRHVVIDEV